MNLQDETHVAPADGSQTNAAPPASRAASSGLDRGTFNSLREIIYEKSGISLNEGKEALVCSRIAKRMRPLGISSYRDYLKHVQADETGEEIVELLDAISTNVTHFFREPEHFDILGEAFRKWLDEGQTRFRFWSAASSTGEEPYTIAMTLLEGLGGRKVDIRILATDISTQALGACRRGVYRRAKMDKVPGPIMSRYFEPAPDGDDSLCRIRKDIQDLVTFKRLNLSTPPFPMQGPLDVVFCRNVMIYFDNAVRKRLLTEVCRLLKPGGLLMVGHAESLTGMMCDLKSIKPSIYVKQ